MCRSLFLMLLILTSVLPVYSQEDRYNGTDSKIGDLEMYQHEGTFNLYQDERLDLMLSRFINLNHAGNGMPGYRIQIFFGSGRSARESAFEAKAKFISDFPDVPAYVEYQTPYHKVRVGDFRTKQEAYALFQKLRNKFPNAYITPLTTINLPPLND